MKIRTTRKEVLQSFDKVYRISQELGDEISRYINPDYYTCGVYGWNSDIYKVNYSFALVYGIDLLARNTQEKSNKSY